MAELNRHSIRIGVSKPLSEALLTYAEQNGLTITAAARQALAHALSGYLPGAEIAGVEEDTELIAFTPEGLAEHDREVTKKALREAGRG